MGKHEKKKKQDYRNREKSSKRQKKENHSCMCTSCSCPDGNTSDSSSLVRTNWTFTSDLNSEIIQINKLTESKSGSSKINDKLWLQKK